MNTQFLVTDTHPLVWYLSKKDSKLPKKIFAAFKSAEEGLETHIWVPSPVVWEISQLMRKTNRISALGTFEELIYENFFFKNITLTDLEPKDIVLAHRLNFNKDPFDALIVATAQRLDLPLITGDAEINDSKTCQVIWR